MLNNVLANFYETDIRKLIEEVNLFRNEVDRYFQSTLVFDKAQHFVPRMDIV